MVVWMIVIAVLELSRSEVRISSRFENTGVGFSTIVVDSNCCYSTTTRSCFGDTADSNSNVFSSNVVRDSEDTFFSLDIASSIYYHYYYYYYYYYCCCHYYYYYYYYYWYRYNPRLFVGIYNHFCLEY